MDTKDIHLFVLEVDEAVASRFTLVRTELVIQEVKLLQLTELLHQFEQRVSENKQRVSENKQKKQRVSENKQCVSENKQIKYQGVKEFHMLAHIGCFKIMIFSPFKLKFQIPYYYPLNQWFARANQW